MFRCWQFDINNSLMLINIQIYRSNSNTVLKKKLFLRHNFEKKKNGKEESSAR